MTLGKQIEQTLTAQCQRYSKSCCLHFMMYRDNPCPVCLLSHLSDYETCHKCFDKELKPGLKKWQLNLACIGDWIDKQTVKGTQGKPLIVHGHQIVKTVWDEQSERGITLEAKHDQLFIILDDDGKISHAVGC